MNHSTALVLCSKFSSLDLKSGYWQVEPAEETKSLTAFSVVTLKWCMCKQMLFEYTNAPATF